MRTYPRLLWPLAFLFALCVFGWAYAYAADAPPVSDPPINWTMFVPLATMLLGIVAGSIRSFTPVDGFFHTTIGHGIITLAGFIIGGAMSFLQAGHFTRYAALNALLGAGVAWAKAFKTDGKPASDVVAEPSKPAGGGGTAAVLLLLSLFSFSASGCAWAKCELSQLPKTGQTLIALVTQALAGATWEQDLAIVAQNFLPERVDCVVAALVNDAGKHQLSATGLAVIEHGKIYLAKQGGVKHACRGSAVE